MTDWRDMPSRDDEVRPYFGDREPVIEGPPFDLRRGTTVEAMTPMARALQHIEAGGCGKSDCVGELDSEGCCGLCGWSVTEWRMRMRLEQSPETKADYLPTLPGALFIDEYGPAVVDDDDVAA